MTEIEQSNMDIQTAIDDKVQELKQKHNLKEVFVLKVGDKTCYLRKPNRKDISMARSLGAGDYIAVQELLLESVWLEGDESIKTDDDYFLNALPKLETLIEAKASELKKS